MAVKTTQEAEEERREANRAVRIDNYRAKAAADFRCGKCGTTNRVLAVTLKATGDLSTRCEGCLDLRSDVVRPLQFDERERDAAR